MLETVSKGFRSASQRFRGQRELTQANVEDALRDVRVALLEADVEFNVVKRFLSRVEEACLGDVVDLKVKHEGKTVEVSPGDHFTKVCHDELEALMGPVDTSITMATQGLTRIMMVGLQGAGKTTTTGKLARLIEAEYQKKCCLVAADIYRPAAVDQLKVLGERLGMPVYHREGASPVEICDEATAYAREQGCDVLLLDTAGRLAIDEVLMQELESIRSQSLPQNIFLVLDAMIGQDAVKTAAEFNRRLEIDGVILTKMDGDARGGSALSVKEVTGKPIKFVGVGEGLDKLEAFRPEGMADRILGFGDIVGLMKDFESVVDEKQAEEDAKNMLSGNFNMHQFMEQIRTIKKMGSLKDLVAKMPFFGGALPEGANLDDGELVKVEAMISSMTKQEREQPELIDDSRRARIARGSGRKPEEVAGLMERFFAMRQMMGNIGQNPGLLGRIPGMQQLAALKQMKGGAEGDMLQEMMGAGNQFAGMSKTQLARYANQLKRSGQPVPADLKQALKGATGGGGGGGNQEERAASLARKQDRRKKAKQAKMSRKKGRKKK